MKNNKLELQIGYRLNFIDCGEKKYVRRINYKV